LQSIDDAAMFAAHLADDAVAGFLAAYSGQTRSMYEADLRIYFAWCEKVDVDPMMARRVDLEMFGRYLENGRGNKPASVGRRLRTLRQFYRVTHGDEMIPHDPGRMLRIPAPHYDPSAIYGLAPLEMTMLLQAAQKRTPQEGALITLMTVLGLRVSTALSLNVGDVDGEEHGHRVIRYTTKFSKDAVAAVPAPVGRILDAAAAGRDELEPLILRRDGQRMDRNCAWRRVKSIARDAGLPADRIHPHTLRGSAITALLDAGVPLRDVQYFANHADAKTTLGYDRRGRSLDRHPSYVLSHVLAA
jgi:site-specific recombinase XerD